LIPSSDDAQPKPLKAADVLKRAHDSAAARGNTATKQAYKGLFTLIIIISAVCIV
jgi:hypothetical protein